MLFYEWNISTLQEMALKLSFKCKSKNIFKWGPYSYHVSQDIYRMRGHKNDTYT